MLIKFKKDSRVRLRGRVWATSVGSKALYWYNTSDNNWFNPNSWYTDSNHETLAVSLPDASTNVYVLGTVKPFADLDTYNSWVDPNAINVGTYGMSLSGTAKNVATNFQGSGTLSISGSITIKDPNLQ
jgi:hypothetical protein